MRVISGSVKGRPLKAVPGNGTRPTSDKVKEAIFSSIGPYFTGGTVLDLFAGTGALGIEALSRGMDKAIFIDAEQKSIDVIRHNLQTTKLIDQAEIYRNDATRAIKAMGKRAVAFDLVFLDPPYADKYADGLLQTMEQLSMFQPNGTVVVEHAASLVYPQEIGLLKCVRYAVYGDSAVTIYRNQEVH